MQYGPGRRAKARSWTRAGWLLGRGRRLRGDQGDGEGAVRWREAPLVYAARSKRMGRSKLTTEHVNTGDGSSEGTEMRGDTRGSHTRRSLGQQLQRCPGRRGSTLVAVRTDRTRDAWNCIYLLAAHSSREGAREHTHTHNTLGVLHVSHPVICVT